MKRSLLVAVLCACEGEPYDGEPLGDYTTWARLDTWGHAPGHGDTYRIIYVNDIGTRPRGAEVWPEIDTVVVKEVHKRDADGSPGSLHIIEIMRRVGDNNDENKGWLFTSTDRPDGQWYFVSLRKYLAW